MFVGASRDNYLFPNIMSYPSKTKMSVCYYCSMTVKDEYLTRHCKEQHGKPRRVKGQQTLSFTPKISEPVRKKNKPDDAHNDENDKSDEPNENAVNFDPTVQLIHSTRDADVTDSRSCGNEHQESRLVVGDVCLAVAENGKKLDTVIDEIRKLNLGRPVNVSENSMSKEETLLSVGNEVDSKLSVCKTVEDICNSFDEITYVPEEKVLSCIRCVIHPSQGGAHVPGRFSYDLLHDETYRSTNVTTQEFRNLKKSIKRHIGNEIHTDAVREWEETQKYDARRETRVHSIGMRIARLCYAGYQVGTSKRNFEEDVYKSVLNGVDLGDINHSKEFYSDYMPYVSKAVSGRVKIFFESRLEQTGFSPPLNVQADKGTNCHRTRQFTSVITIVPESPNLLNVIYLGQPVVKNHDGPGISESISNELTDWGIKGTQVEGGSFDGQYFHLSVPDHLREKMNLSEQFLCTWDPMHKGGVVDSHIREDESFAWLVEIQTLCKEIYTTFNWGKNYENFLEICDDLDIGMKKLTNFQKTRFANSMRFVFINIRTDYAAVRQALSDLVSSKEQSSNNKDRAKAEECRSVLRKINSWVFTLTLSGSADIYGMFGALSNVCQVVDVLPFERYDRAKHVIEKLKKMFSTMDHSSCSEKCLWERYHADVSARESMDTYMDTSISNVNLGTTRQTRLTAQDDSLAIADGINLVQERLYTLAWRLHHDLSAELFDNETEVVIEHCRVVSDLKMLVSKIYEKGCTLVGFEESAKFVKSARAITGTIASISDDDLVKSYRNFVTTIHEIFIKPVGGSFQPSKWNNKKMIQRLIEKDTSKSFIECRIITHIIMCACVKVSVESVVESIVSRYEKHFHHSRQPSEEHSLNEMIIAENGPFLHQADEILESSMDRYWKENTTSGEWHFLRKTNDIRSYTGGASKVVGKLLDRQSKLPFM